jgi:hypothetical protein
MVGMKTKTLIKKSAGVTILVMVFGAMFWLTALKEGWLFSATVWIGSFTVAAIIAFAIWLLVD